MVLQSYAESHEKSQLSLLSLPWPGRPFKRQWFYDSNNFSIFYPLPISQPQKAPQPQLLLSLS
jgi:hypothetical protein